jgi:hypothetical protein
MISFTLWLAISSQMVCDGSPHRRECVAWVSECLASAEDTPEGRDAKFEWCSEILDPYFWEEKQ